MKKYTILILSFLFICLFFAYGLNAQHGIVVFGKDTLFINNIDLDNISHSEDGVSFTCYDTILTKSIADVDSISIMKIPECIVIEQGIDDWSEMRLCSDGTVTLTKMSNENTPLKMMMMCPNDSLGAVFSKITFDENAYPVEITMNEYRILVDWIGETQFNLTILSPDSIAYRVDRLSYIVEQRECGKRFVPDIDKKPWMTRLGGVLELAGGGVAFVGGAALIVGSGVAEIGSAGSSTPISVPGIVTGSLSVKDGIESMFNGWINAFTNDYVNGLDPIINNLSSLAATKTFEKSIVPNLPNKLFPYLADSKYTINDLYSLIPTLLGEAISNIEKPYTWYDLVKDVQENILTGLSKNITQTSATTRGYINPFILESPSVKFETEYGMIVYSTINSKERYIQKIYNGDGGMIEFIFNDLNPGTTYNYSTYYIDKTNNVLAVAKEKSFTTLSLPVKITDFKQTGSHYEKDGYMYNGWTYSYKYDVTVTVELTDSEGVEDWGYVYEDPNGKIARISLKDFSSPYSDSRYVYYRNEASSTVRLYEFVKYKGSEYYEYGEPVDYNVQMSYLNCPDDNHPHAIDLGLPSGTKWACCNVGANNPEEFGEYYTWGMTRSTIDATNLHDIYDYIDLIAAEEGRVDVPFIDIGDDISGTQYDVAHVKWGDSWQIPTREQFQELFDNISEEIELYAENSQDSLIGIVIIGPNGNGIWIPPAGSFSPVNTNSNILEDGIYIPEGFGGVGQEAAFWTSERSDIFDDSEMPPVARQLVAWCGRFRWNELGPLWKWNSIPIRPICK